jgi:hypothetical protein
VVVVEKISLCRTELRSLSSGLTYFVWNTIEKVSSPMPLLAGVNSDEDALDLMGLVLVGVDTAFVVAVNFYLCSYCCCD